MLWSKTLSGSSQGRCKTRPGKITTYFNFSYSRSLSNWNIGICKRKWSRKYVTRGLGELPGHINIFRVKKTQKHSYLPGFNVVLFPMEGKFIRGGIVLLISRFLLSHIEKNTQSNIFRCLRADLDQRWLSLKGWWRRRKRSRSKWKSQIEDVSLSIKVFQSNHKQRKQTRSNFKFKISLNGNKITSSLIECKTSGRAFYFFLSNNVTRPAGWLTHSLWFSESQSAAMFRPNRTLDCVK